MATEQERNRGAGAYSTPGVDKPFDKALAQIITGAPEVHWRFTNLEPSGGLYISRDDLIQVDCVNSVAGQTFGVHARQLLPDGRIQPHFFIFAPTSDRSVNHFFVQLSEGFLLTLSAGTALNTTQKGQTFIAIRFVRGSPNNATTTGVLIAGYMAGLTNITWPIMAPTYAGDNTGNIRSITGATPGAGLTNLETVPTGARWRLKCYKFSLTTSAAVANREVALFVDDGVNPLMTVTSAFTQVASQAFGYNYAPGLQTLAPTVGTNRTSPWSDVLLEGGYRIQVAVNNIQAADQLSAAQYEVEEWVNT